MKKLVSIEKNIFPVNVSALVSDWKLSAAFFPGFFFFFKDKGV